MKKENFDEIKDRKCNKFVWVGRNTNQVQGKVTKHSLQIKENQTVFDITVTRIMDTKWIEIESRPTPVWLFYEIANIVRRFEYLLDGAFYLTVQCKMDNTEILAEIRSVELGYFQSANRKRRIPLILTEKEYQTYFRRWIVLERDLGIINQMMLYAGNINGLPVDVRMSMAVECYEALARKLEKQKLVTKKTPTTLANSVVEILDGYGEPVFATEHPKWHTLVPKIVKTRNMIFHVNQNTNNTLDASCVGFYAVKLDWLYRYIVWLLLGYDRDLLNQAVQPEITAFESNFPQLIFK